MTVDRLVDVNFVRSKLCAEYHWAWDERDKQTKGLQGTVMHLTAQEVAGLRQDFERGLLAAILDEQRTSGVALMRRVAQAFSGEEQADNTWHLLWRWLDAIHRGDAVLTAESFVLLRDAGRYLKALDQQGAGAELPALTPLRTALTGLVVELDAQPPEKSERWARLLDDLDYASDVADLRSGFQQVYDCGVELGWTDVIEICGAQNNLLDRLLDGTLAIDSNHYRVLSDAKLLLRDLDAPQADDGPSRPSQIVDLWYERVIERADVLASGGEFDLAADDGPQAMGATAQLAAVLDRLPGLLQEVREEVAGDPADSSLDHSLEKLGQAVQALQEKLPD